ncbi:hypothetical protein [Oryzomicrobium sp.]|uniref:hypothetical protein n=1 Tax=Oryzomicrobium sp. TaxID=1911578 RepID=UPI002FE1FA92
MAKKNRTSLKHAFSEGAQPSAESFADLIDSALNVVDDGFDRSDEDGFRVAQLGKTGKLISFFENIAVRRPSWFMRLSQGSRRLFFGSESEKPVLTLSSETVGDQEATRVGINKADPAHELDVDGVVAAKGRIGSQGASVKADGQWHDIAGPLDGCRAFEVIAGVGDKDAGRYALLHAFALNTFNRKGHVTPHQSYYGSRCDQLDLRWVGDTHAYTLQLRTRCAYGEHVAIQFYLTDLWFDPFMRGSDIRAAGAAPGAAPAGANGG